MHHFVAAPWLSSLLSLPLSLSLCANSTDNTANGVIFFYSGHQFVEDFVHEHTGPGGTLQVDQWDTG